MAIFRVAPHPAVVKLRDESRDLASPYNEKSPPAKWYCVMQCLHSFVINELAAQEVFPCLEHFRKLRFGQGFGEGYDFTIRSVKCSGFLRVEGWSLE